MSRPEVTTDPRAPDETTPAPEAVRTATPHPNGPRSISFDLHERRRLLLLGDGLAAAIAAALAVGAWGAIANNLTLEWFRHHSVWIPILIGAWLACAALTGSYLSNDLRTKARSAVGVLSTALLFFGLYLLAYFLAPRTLLPRIVVLGFAVFAVALVVGWRRIWDWAHGRTAFTRRALVVGTGAVR